MVKVWEIANGREVLTLDHPSGMIERVAFSPDGQRLATSGWDGAVKLWETETGLEVLALRSHGGRVWGVNFSPDGQFLVSAAADGVVVLWDTSPPAERKPRAPDTAGG